MGGSEGQNPVPGTGLRILVVDDDKVTRDLLREIFEREGYVVELVPSGGSGPAIPLQRIVPHCNHRHPDARCC